MADAADRVTADDERSMELVEAQLRERRIAESMKGFDPNAPRHCGDCGIEIPHARLMAYPMTGRCIECERLAERMHQDRWRGG